MKLLDWLRPKAKPPPASTGYGSELLYECNEARMNLNIAPLNSNSLLVSAANEHSMDMAVMGVLSHSGFPERIDNTGYKYISLAENVSGFPTAKETVEAWLKSQPHRNNLLGDFKDAGCAGAMNNDGRWFWTMIVGNPK